MNNEEIHKLDMKSKDIVEDNISKISELFPDCINEGKIDFEMLKQELAKDIIESGKERYQLTWVGKKEALVNANTPCNKTLRPVKEKSADFENTKNIYIEGDNLEVLKILQESYLNKIKCIYIDPPYNTGKDFVYSDNFFKESTSELMESGQVDEYNNKLVSNNESSGRFHSDWLNMIYPRVKIAKNLLSKDGIIFISIDDNEQDNAKKICNEVFGEKNFVAQLIRRTINSGKHDAIGIAPFHEYVLIYCKNIDCLNLNKKLKDQEARNSLYPNKDEHVNERGRFYITQLNKNSIQYSDSLNYPIVAPDGTEVWPGQGFEDKKWCWRWGKQKLNWGLENDFIVFKKNNDKWKVYTKSYEFIDKDGNKIKRSNPYSSLEFIDKKYANFNATPELEKLFGGKKYFDFPKAVLFIKELLYIAKCENEIVLDFFSGSATTAEAVMRLNAEDNGNRHFILVQLPENCNEKSEAYKDGYKTICDIGEERIKRAGNKIRKETNANIDYGFRVYKVDSSNMKDVYYTPTDLQQSQLNMFESNIKENRTAEDLLTQVILDLGLTLDLSIEEKKILNNNVYFVENNSLIACFDDTIDINIVDEICKCNPLKIVFKESSFKTDSDKINVFERIKKLSNDTEINII